MWTVAFYLCLPFTTYGLTLRSQQESSCFFPLVSSTTKVALEVVTPTPASELPVEISATSGTLAHQVLVRVSSLSPFLYVLRELAWTSLVSLGP